MLWIADKSSQRPSANAPKTEVHLRSDRAPRFGGRAGPQPCHIGAARSAAVASRAHLRDALQCAAFVAACIRGLRGGFVPSSGTNDLPRASRKGRGKYSRFSDPKPRARAGPNSQLVAPIIQFLIDTYCRLEVPLTHAESSTSVFLIDNFLRGPFRPPNPPTP